MARKGTISNPWNNTDDLSREGLQVGDYYYGEDLEQKGWGRGVKWLVWATLPRTRFNTLGRAGWVVEREIPDPDPNIDAILWELAYPPGR